MSKTAMMKLYEMLEDGNVSEIAEIKEYFLMLEEKQISGAFLDGYRYVLKSAPYDIKYHSKLYYNERYNIYSEEDEKHKE